MERSWSVGSAEDLGLALAEVRRSRGLTQAEAAADAGIGRSWLAKLESGRSTKVLDHLLRVLRRMGATVTVTWADELQDQDHLDDAVAQDGGGEGQAEGPGRG